MARRLDAGRVEIRLEHVIERVRWHPGAVQLLVRRADGAVEVHATQAILTLPLGVLKLPMGDPGAVAIEPLPPGWRAKLGALHMGAANRVVLGFDARWWAPGGGGGLSFVHGTREVFPIWWTALPSRAPVLTGWTGGPRAESLAGPGTGAVLETAVASLASVFGRGEAEVRSHLRSWHAHDWAADPFARGAYSYGGVGAIEARAALARPVGGTLALAGEAVALGGRNGTVHGAIASGRAAARALLG
jgi:monoamine oxidase